MIVTVYSYTQIECSKCKKLSVIQPGKFDTKDILSNSQIGFTKKLKDDKTEEEENVLGGLL